MYEIHANAAQNRLYVTVCGHLDPAERSEAMAMVVREISRLTPGFDMVNDISQAQPTDTKGIEELVQLQVYLLSHGLRHVVRLTRNLLTELQFERASKQAGLQAIIVNSMAHADQLLDCSLDPERSSGRNWNQLRKFRRIPVGSDYTVRFTLKGQKVVQVRMRDLSAQGACLLLKDEIGQQIQEGFILNDFRFEHSDLPDTEIAAKVVRVQHGLAEVPENPVGLGVQFLTASEHFTQWVDAYVMAYYGMAE